MAQLKDDCFAFGGDLLPLGDALESLQGRVTSIAKAKNVPLDDCLGRVVASDIVSDIAVPPHDNSAVDGYAVYFDDLNEHNETRLPIGGRVAAGHPLGRAARPGEAIRIFTGAPVPNGADGTQATGPDTIFMEEDVVVEDGVVVFPIGLKRGSNRRYKAEDIDVGSLLIGNGTQLRPQDIGLAASIGLTALSVYEPLRACVFSMGDEIQDPGQDRRDGAVFDANRYTLIAMLRNLGLQVTDLGILPDNQPVIESAIADAALNHDLIVTSGGVSAGEEDHVKAAIEKQGRLDFWRLAIKPGRPVALGNVRFTDGKGYTPFFGLPGNPVAAMVTFMMIARPVIMMLQGVPSDAVTPTRYRVLSGFSAKKKQGRREWLRARLEVDVDGNAHVQKFRSSGAGILTSMAASTGLVELSEDVTEVSPGDVLDYLPFNEVM